MSNILHNIENISNISDISNISNISNISYYILFLLLLLSVINICSKIFLYNAILLSPNISYCQIIVNLNIIISLILSYFLFNEEINIKSLLGIFIAIIGVTIVIYNSNNY